MSTLQQRLQILLRGGDWSNIEVLHEIVQHIGRDKRRQGGAETDIFDTQVQQRQQNAHCLLLIPREHQRQGQVVDPAAERLRQGQRDFDSPVGVVALSYIHQPRQPADGPKIQVVEAEFAAGQRQHHSVGGRLLDKLGIVVPPGAGSVTAADQEKVPDGTALYCLDHLLRHAQHRTVTEAGHDRAAAVDAGKRLVLVVATQR